MTEEAEVMETSTAPVRAMWVTMLLGWVLFLIPIPLVSTLLGILALSVSGVLLIVVIVKGRVAAALSALVVGTFGTPVAWLLSNNVYRLLAN
ncbi:MAG: hypothetical protein IPG63_17990 [Xanthomonadales bacterium]|nr:hypothetical protein [Xanthomonadales bacterium]